MMTNQSGLQPLGQAVLLRMHEPEKRKGLIEIPVNVQESRSVMEQQAEVIAVGPEAWYDEGNVLLRCVGINRPRARVGDKVLVTKFAGYVTRGTADGQLYRLVNDRDIFCKITKEKEDE